MNRPGRYQRSAWIVTLGRDQSMDFSRDKIFHANLECPAVRNVIVRPSGNGEVLEVDVATGFYREWWHFPSRGWKLISDGQLYDVREWRPCLRCGQVSTDSPAAPGAAHPATCPACHLLLPAIGTCDSCG